MKVSKPAFLTFLFLGISLAWFLGWRFYYEAHRPTNPKGSPLVIEIKQGSHLKQIALALESKRLIRSATVFRILAYLKNNQNKIKSGEYELSPADTAAGILQKLTEGQSVLHPVTFPEGFNRREIAGLLEQKGLADSGKFLKLSADADFIRALGFSAPTLEGYLFPETYHFNKTTGADKIIRTMADTFKKQTRSLNLETRARTLNFSPHEIVTLASIIEKETGKNSERRVISSVFHNRLKKNMRLQSDPTVIFAIKDFDGNIRKKDLSIDSPYNTYRYKGLPPGPIANPGIESIRAALAPAETGFIYFVSKQDGSHKFSTNLIEHNRAVRKYQLKRIHR